ncbi:hypothetical protein OHA21_41525 [Actinoplanes sp. NBC_00393]|uniref:hypothetical protein n=1 Tax=Actinoplanes sp. NBC_00393 TaxID=2975953 RepID=UPI002E24D73A
MRRTVLVLAAVAGLTLITGCTESPESLDGAAAPVGGAVSRSAPTPAAVTESPSAAPSTDPPVTTTTRPPKPKASSVLGPDGLGALKLGMSFTAAKKTGLLVSDDPAAEVQGCNSNYYPKSSGDSDAAVFFNGDKGLVSFTAYRGVATPEGIKLGSSLAAVKKAYSDWDVLTGPGEDGRGWVKVPGNSKAVYNITIAEDEVVHMNLQLRDQDCYE